MGKWSPWQPEGTRKLRVKFRRLRLEGLGAFAGRAGVDGRGAEQREEEAGAAIFLEVKWRGPKQGLVQFPRTATRRTQVTARGLLTGDAALEWDEGELIECACGVGGSLAPWEVSFKVLRVSSGWVMILSSRVCVCCVLFLLDWVSRRGRRRAVTIETGSNSQGDCAERKPGLAVIGKVSLNLAEMASKMESAVVKKLPISLQVAGDTCEATLMVSESDVYKFTTHASLSFSPRSLAVRRFLRKVSFLGHTHLLLSSFSRHSNNFLEFAQRKNKFLEN